MSSRDDHAVGDATGAYTDADASPNASAAPDGRTELLDEGRGVYVPRNDSPAPRANDTAVHPDHTIDSPAARGPSPGDETCDVPPRGQVGDATADFGATGGPRAAGTTQASSPLADKAESSKDDEAPRTGRYLLRRFHAKGGMGEIWIAEDSDIGRSVALKKMRGNSVSMKDQFLHEAQVTGQLEHPGVVPVHELGQDEAGQPFYVMKFVHGRTLTEVIDAYHGQEPKPGAEPKEVQLLKLLNMFVSLCQTMAYAHSREVIHRDLKPDNVMVGPFGETLVLDWGLAKVMGQPDATREQPSVRLSMSGDTMETMDGTVKGTPTYMSPEMAHGRVDEIDQVSDIYLLGATLYHILTGHKPRTAKKLGELLMMARNQAPRPPREIKPSIPKPLAAICQKAIATKKEDRYPSAAALAEDMQRYLAGEPVVAYRETFTERAWRWIRRHQKVLARTAAAALVIGTIVTAVLVVREAESRTAAAQARAAELTSQEQARKDLARFQALAEEARFFAANSDPMEEKAPFFDPKKGEARSDEALALAASWGPGLINLPLGDRVRDDAKQELADLALLSAQVKVRDAQPERLQAALGLLGLVENVGTPTRHFFRLRGDIHKLLGDATRAEADRERADAPQVATRALDHFLRAEALRVEAGQVSPDRKESGGKDRRSELLGKAAEQFRKALALDPDHYWSHYQLGRTYLGLGKGAEAIGALGTCIALRPNSPWSYSVRGMALSGLGRYDEAMADMDRALQLDPEFRPARLNWAVARSRQKKQQGDADLTDVLAALDAVLAPPADKRLLEAAFFRGTLFLERGEYERALEDFDLVLAGKLEYPLVHLNRARIFLVRGEPDAALESLNVYLASGRSFDPASPDAFERRGKELRALASEFRDAASRKRRQEVQRIALAQLQSGVKQGSKSATLYDELGGALELVGKTKEAIDAYTRALELDPKGVKVLVKRGWAWEKTDPPAYDQARKDFADALAIDRGHAEAHTGLGYIEAWRKAPAVAHRHANLALLHAGGDYLILHNVASIYATLSQTDPARTREHQDLTMDLLRRALELWRKGDRQGPDELVLITRDPAFPQALRARPEFVELTKPDRN